MLMFLETNLVGMHCSMIVVMGYLYCLEKKEQGIKQLLLSLYSIPEEQNYGIMTILFIPKRVDQQMVLLLIK